MKTIKILALMAVALPLALTSCSDDDEEEDEDDVAVLTDTDGNKVLVKQIVDEDGDACFSFTYDSDNQCTYIGYYDDAMWSLGYSPFTMTYLDYYSDDVATFSSTGTLNSQGLLSACEYAYSYGDDDGKEKEAFTCTFNYNSSKQLTSITCREDWTEAWASSGTVYYMSVGYEESKFTLTWSDGNLTKVEVDWLEEYEYKGKSTIDADTYAYTITYGTKENSARQYLALMYWFEEYPYELEGLGFTGLLGVGPKMLPSKVVEDGEDDDTGTTCTYVLNSDGTIAVEKITWSDGGWWEEAYFKYSYADATTRAAAEPATPISAEKVREIMRSKREARAARRARHSGND